MPAENIVKFEEHPLDGNLEILTEVAKLLEPKERIKLKELKEKQEALARLLAREFSTEDFSSRSLPYTFGALPQEVYRHINSSLITLTDSISYINGLSDKDVVNIEKINNYRAAIVDIFTLYRYLMS